jgi:ATP-dependent DNA ligase
MQIPMTLAVHSLRERIRSICVEKFTRRIHACQLGFEGIVSKRLGSPYVSGRSRYWLKFRNPAAPAVKREAEEEWGRGRWR